MERSGLYEEFEQVEGEGVKVHEKYESSTLG